ncbi:hypothetical protein R1flu_022975 [Riccia fluitans]|uniref:Uncharacterized protein n=1 Tax=Riccia fluitans TaxID=41844 RepID=A0ABD1XRE8_9MARC
MGGFSSLQLRKFEALIWRGRQLLGGREFEIFLKSKSLAFDNDCGNYVALHSPFFRGLMEMTCGFPSFGQMGQSALIGIVKCTPVEFLLISGTCFRLLRIVCYDLVVLVLVLTFVMVDFILHRVRCTVWWNRAVVTEFLHADLSSYRLFVLSSVAPSFSCFG